YLSGAVQWYGDVLGLVFLVFLLAGAVNLATGGGELFRKLTAFLVATVPVLVLLGLVRAVALLRRGTGASWRDALGAFFIWQSTSLVVARASILGLFAKKAAFLRTPKTSEKAKWWEALRANWAETFLALLGMAGIAAALTKATELAALLLARLLLFPPPGMAAAPFNSWAAHPGGAARGPAADPHHGVEAQPAPPGVRARGRTQRARHRVRRDHRRPGAVPGARTSPGAAPEPGRADPARAVADAHAVADHVAHPVSHADHPDHDTDTDAHASVAYRDDAQPIDTAHHNT